MSSNDIISGNFNSEKLMKMMIFAMKIYYIPSHFLTQVYHIQKIIIGVSCTLKTLTFIVSVSNIQ